MARNKKIEFVMDTDWMFEKPIDREHKEYKLLSYFQRMGEKLDNMELYPGFIELSLHLANIQTLIKDKKIIYHLYAALPVCWVRFYKTFLLRFLGRDKNDK